MEVIYGSSELYNDWRDNYLWKYYIKVLSPFIRTLFWETTLYLKLQIHWFYHRRTFGRSPSVSSNLVFVFSRSNLKIISAQDFQPIVFQGIISDYETLLLWATSTQEIKMIDNWFPIWKHIQIFSESVAKNFKIQFHLIIHRWFCKHWSVNVQKSSLLNNQFNYHGGMFKVAWIRLKCVIGSIVGVIKKSS